MSPDAGGAKRCVKDIASILLQFPLQLSLNRDLYFCRVTSIADRLNVEFALIHKEVY